MKKVSKSIPAKTNFTLDVLGVEGKFHNIESLVASVNLFDVVTVSKRNDKKITITNKGIPVDCPPSENNAFKTASLFMQRFDTLGVNITINKGIPVGAGLGGSSADIAGVLLAMKELFSISADMKTLAEKLGSDATYMLSGGYAVMRGKGEKIKKIDGNEKIYMLAILSEQKVCAKDCYKKYDNQKKHPVATTKHAVKAFINKDMELFYKLIKNDLEPASKKLAPEIDFNLTALKKAGAITSFVSGSGPTAIGVFKGKAERNKAFAKLSPLFEKKILKIETVNN
ncbi:MAG: 4-(cytidine 5'-diphospho)-2-C-methyl-D-erythritol kinase [Clostridia bacterium]|nr:4-(cytidine 5'-diphospho)-2-C-methyl-D-erythritol kinase [Clostridia bacterium]